MVALCMLWAIAAGAQEAVYLVGGGQLPIEVAANGYVQSVVSRSDGQVEVRVAVALGPIGSTGSYAELEETTVAGVPAGFQLPKRLRARLQPHLSAWEAATRVLEWAAQHIEVDAADGDDQDARSVLDRGRGRCSGVANATTALLMAAGFDAKTVSGVLVTDDGWIPHRWVACRLPGAGWVHTDPTLGLWTMTPRHLAFADAVTGRPQLRVVAPGTNEIGRLPRRAGRPVRPELGSQLVCRLVGRGPTPGALATLHGAAGEIHRAALDPEGSFTALLPGRWRLVVTVNDDLIQEAWLELKPGQVHSFTVSLPPAEGGQEMGS